MPEARVDVRLRIEGHHLPGRRCGPYDEVRVALQVGRDPVDPVAGDATEAVWETALSVVEPPGGEPDVRGPAVHGRRGERFAYLTWGAGDTDDYRMFRRAKLPLDEVPALVAHDPRPSQVTARVDLTGDDGMPRCARLRPAVVAWSRS